LHEFTKRKDVWKVNGLQNNVTWNYFPWEIIYFVVNLRHQKNERLSIMKLGPYSNYISFCFPDNI